ncbi:MAG: PAS domain S-box protein [Desulfobulbaceae bacterium]|nr:PAS domain S-box protein [Desulfobulbaceae bacterium]
MKKARKTQTGNTDGSLSQPNSAAGKQKPTAVKSKPDRTNLRQTTEDLLERDTGCLDKLSRQELKKIIQELNHHRIQLERQNEQLRTARAEHEQAQLKYAELYDSAPVGCFTFNPEGVTISLNLTGASVLGRARNELLNRSFADFVHEEDRDTFLRYISNLIKKKNREGSRIRLVKKDGSVLHIHLEGLPVTNDQDTLVEIRTTAIDVSKQIQAERDQQQKASLLKAIIDSTEVMLVYLDHDFNFVWVNPAYAQSCGMQPEDMAGRNHFDLFPHAENEAIFKKVRDSGEPVFFKDKPFEFPGQPERGITYWDWSLTPVKNSDGRVYGLVFSLRETTQYKRAELALARSEEEFRLIAETSADIIFQTDTRGRITYISPAVQQIGYTPEQVRGRLFAEFIPAGELADAEAVLQAVNRGKPISLLELPIIKADGTTDYCEVSATPLKRKGFAAGIQGIARVITERRTTEQKIRLRTEVLKGINSIFKVGIRCANDQELAREALRIAEEVTGSGFGFIGEIDQDGLLQDLAISAPGWENCSMSEQTGHRQLPGNFQAHGLYGQVVTEGRAFFTNDPARHPQSKGTPEGHPPLTSFLGVPLNYGNKTIGLIALGNRKDGYREDELESLEMLAPSFIEVLFKCRAERALAASRTREYENALRFKQFLDFTPVPVWIAHDPECRVITSNMAAANLLGVEPDMNITQSPASGLKSLLIRQFKDGRELTVEEMPLQYAVANGIRVDDVEVDILPPNGQLKRMKGAATPLFDNDGNVQGGIAAYIDITDRKWLEDQLLQAKQEWEKTFDAVPDLIAILDPQHRIIRANRSMSRKMGMTPGQCVGMRCYSCVHGGSGPLENCPHIMTLQDGREHRAEVREERWGGDYLVSTTPLFDDQGEIMATVHVARDITDRKEAEQQIMCLNKNLQRSIRELAIMNQELKRSNDDLQQYAYIISHDLQEPLRTISSFLQLLRRRYRGALDDKADVYIDYTIDGASHMQGLLQDLLLFSRLGGGSLTVQAVSLEAVVQKTMMNLQRAIEENGAEIQISSLPTVDADETQLMHVFQNLIANAIKFHGENPPRVHISAERKNSEWIICVRDNGIGINPQYAERIFLIFQRLHRRGEYAGTGIGLAICRKIVERHGGRIWVESAPGQGASFYFALPAEEENGGEVF